MPSIHSLWCSGISWICSISNNSSNDLHHIIIILYLNMVKIQSIFNHWLIFMDFLFIPVLLCKKLKLHLLFHLSTLLLVIMELKCKHYEGMNMTLIITGVISHGKKKGLARFVTLILILMHHIVYLISKCFF